MPLISWFNIRKNNHEKEIINKLYINKRNNIDQ